jgi:long-chain acyl-CoA synthetase
LQSPYIKQIVLVGQDKPSLGALVVPDYDNIKSKGEIDGSVMQLIQQEVRTLVQSRENYRPFERVSAIRIINEEFSLTNGLMTQTSKIKRNKVFEKYVDMIEDMFS